MPDGDVSYDGAIDEFLGEQGGTEEAVEDEAPKPEPKKEQPAKAKTGGKQPAARKEASADDSDDDDSSEEEGDAKPKDGPWKSELAKRGIDTPEVNQYMQEVVQPYITRLEQQGGPIAALFEGNEEAAQLGAGILEGLDTDPADTIAYMIAQLDVPDDAINEALAKYLDGAEEGDEPMQPEGGEEEELSPEQQWIRQQMQQENEAQEREAYDAMMKQIGEEFGPGFDEDLFNIAVAATGDFEAAMDMYPALVEKYAKPAAKPAPPVMGRNRPGTQPQPQQKTYDGSNEGWNEAFDDFFAEAYPKRR